MAFEACLETGTNLAIKERRVVLLINTHSRRGKELFGVAQEQLTAAGVKVERAVACDKKNRMWHEVQVAIRSGTPIIVVGGGDGTINLVAGAMMTSSTTLGILPLGTGNALALDLGIPLALEGACRVIAEGKEEFIDMGMANGEPFLNVATVGLTTDIARSLTEPMKRQFGRFAYVYAVANALRHVKPFTAHLETENGSVSFDTLQVVIGNGRFHGGRLRMSPDASIRSGEFQLYSVESSSKAALVKLALMLPSGHQGLLREVHSEGTIGGTLITEPIKSVTVDGEIKSRTPLEFTCIGGSLRTIVPSDSNL